MTFQVEYTFHARSELTETYLWIKEQAPTAAEKWRDDFIIKSMNSPINLSAIQ